MVAQCHMRWPVSVTANTLWSDMAVYRDSNPVPTTLPMSYPGTIIYPSCFNGGPMPYALARQCDS